MINLLIPAVTELASGWLKGKADEKAAVSRTKIARAEAEAEIAKTAVQHDSKWELIMAQSTQNSIRDEIVTIVVLVPVCLVFIPGMEDVVKAGFDRLNELPEWYQGLVYVTCLAALGLKGVDKFKGRK